MIQIRDPEYRNQSCAMQLAISITRRKWNIVLILALRCGAKRFGVLQRQLSPISKKVLAERLQALERIGLVQRRVLSVKPYQVEYMLTDLGRNLLPILSQLQQWGADTLQGLRASDSGGAGSE